MGRSGKIRITKNDRTEYSKLAKNVKAKINRTNKKYGIDLSGEIELPKLSDFTSRKQYNEWKEKASSFTNRHNLNYQFMKNDYNVVTSKAQWNEYERNVKKAQRLAEKKNEEISKLPIMRNGEQIATVGLRMNMLKGIKHTEAFSVPKMLPFNEVRQQGTLEAMFNRMKEKTTEKHYEERNIKMRDIFAEQMQWAMDMIGYEDTERLVDYVKNMNPQEFYEMYLQEQDMNFEIFGSPRDLDDGVWIDSQQQLGGLGIVANAIEKHKQGMQDRDFFHIPNK